MRSHVRNRLVNENLLCSGEWNEQAITDSYFSMVSKPNHMFPKMWYLWNDISMGKAQSVAWERGAIILGLL